MVYPKVSIMIPTYNRADFLDSAVCSALDQDYPNLEVIVSDNASVDETQQTVQKYLKDPRFRYFRNASNIGLIENWKKLLHEYASGDVGKILADDDYLVERRHVSMAVELMKKRHAQIVLSGFRQDVEEPARPVRSIGYDFDIPEVTESSWWLKNAGKKLKGKYLFLNIISCGLFDLAKARALKAFVPHDYGLDYELLFRMVLTGRTGYLKGCHAVLRSHGGCDGLSHSFTKAQGGCEIFQRLFEMGLSLGYPRRLMAQFRRRNLIVFVNTFLVSKWFTENKVTFRSVFQFYQRLNEFDGLLFFPVMTSYQTLCWLLRIKNSRLYHLLRKACKSVTRKTSP